jgi:chemotaxis signal transduction protein
VKNVLIVAVAEQRLAIELRWVREIFTLGSITPVPTAPPVIAGVVNWKGAIVAVLHGRRMLAPPGTTMGSRNRAPQNGDALVLVDVDGTRAAIAVDRIDAVTTLAQGDGGALLDRDGQLVPLVDPPALIAAARQLVEGTKDVDGGHGARS